MAQLSFKLAAPLMAFGNQTLTNYRTTDLQPTKSAIIGMIAASFGYGRGDQRIKQLNDELKMSYQVIKPGQIMIDYQNIYVTQKKTNVQEWKYYLADAAFKIILTGPLDLLTQIQYQLQHPYFALYIGRRSCPIGGIIKSVLNN